MIDAVPWQRRENRQGKARPATVDGSHDGLVCQLAVVDFSVRRKPFAVAETEQAAVKRFWCIGAGEAHAARQHLCFYRVPEGRRSKFSCTRAYLGLDFVALPTRTSS